MVRLEYNSSSEFLHTNTQPSNPSKLNFQLNISLPQAIVFPFFILKADECFFFLHYSPSVTVLTYPVSNSLRIKHCTIR